MCVCVCVCVCVCLFILLLVDSSKKWSTRYCWLPTYPLAPARLPVPINCCLVSLLPILSLVGLFVLFFKVLLASFRPRRVSLLLFYFILFYFILFYFQKHGTVPYSRRKNYLCATILTTPLKSGNPFSMGGTR